MRGAAATLGRRAAGYFLRPTAEVAAGEHLLAPASDPPPPGSALPPRVAVLGRHAEAAPLAVAVANALRAGHAAPTAAVAVWSPPREPAPVEAPPALALAAAPDAAEPGSRPPSTPAGSRLAVRLRARGLPATARGRLAWIQLADHPVAAALAARRLSGAVEVPVVVVLAGPRGAVLEALLREQDLAVIVTRDPGGALGRLAVSTCEIPAVACAPLPAGPARLLAAAGLAGARALDTPVRIALQRLFEPVPVALRLRAAD